MDKMSVIVSVFILSVRRPPRSTRTETLFRYKTRFPSPASAIVHDIKGENWTLTAGFRARYGRVLLFDPTNAESAAYNPLLEVRSEEHTSELQSLLRISYAVFCLNNKTKNILWHSTTKLLITHATSSYISSYIFTP